MLWFQIPPATLVMGSNPTSCNQFAGLFCYFLGTFGCDTGMKLPDHIKPMTGFQIGNSVLLPEGPAGLGPAQKMRKMRPWLLSDVNTVFFSGSLVHRQTRRLTGYIICMYALTIMGDAHEAWRLMSRVRMTVTAKNMRVRGKHSETFALTTCDKVSVTRLISGTF